jgi:CDP-4-dehydro-6-deoxyglucose reductase
VSVTAHLKPSARTFTVERGETLLEAGLRAGLALGYGCANGSCGKCKARVVTGSVSEVRFHDYVLSASEKHAGYTLLCCATALEDVEVEAGDAGGVDDIEQQTVRARVHKLHPVGEEIMLLTVRTSRSQLLRFLSGQHVDLTVGSLAPRDVPIASCPCDGMHIQFHFRRAPDDPFLAQVFDTLKKSDEVVLEGPRGRFTLDPDSQRPILFLAYDTGFAPVHGLIELAMNLEMPQAMHLYWVAPGPGEHYLHNLCRSWADAFDNFAYHPLIGGGSQKDAAGSGSAGDLLKSAVNEIFESQRDSSLFDAYVAGPEWFVALAVERFSKQGLPRARLFVDTIDTRP